MIIVIVKVRFRVKPIDITKRKVLPGFVCFMILI